MTISTTSLTCDRCGLPDDVLVDDGGEDLSCRGCARAGELPLALVIPETIRLMRLTPTHPIDPGQDGLGDLLPGLYKAAAPLGRMAPHPDAETCRAHAEVLDAICQELRRARSSSRRGWPPTWPGGAVQPDLLDQIP